VTADRWVLLPAAAFDAHASQWDALNARGGGSVLMESRMLACAMRHFGSGAEVLALLSGPEGLRAAAVLGRRNAFTWETFQPSQCPIGAWLQGPGEDLAALLGSLHRRLPLSCLVLSVTQQDPEIVARPQDGPTLRTTDYIETARITVAGDWAGYWSSRGQNLRHNMKRARKKLAQAGLDARLETVTDPAAIADAVGQYGDIETRSWKSGHGTAVSRDNDQGRFYADLLRTFAAHGGGHVWRLKVGDDTAAVDLCLRSPREVVILKTTFDERYGDYSPAFLMREEAFQGVFSARSSGRIEFYGRAMEWHKRWSEELRTMYHATHVRWAWVEGLRRLRSRKAAQPGPAADRVSA
jgi:CelD/BcsL family acetyltransferase involved in cellulose biosynthesis